MSIKVHLAGGKKVNAIVGDFEIKTDQSVHAGGEGSAPDPFTLFLASIGTCVGVYVKSFCDQRKISSDGIRINMEYQYDTIARLIGKIMIDIIVPPDFPGKYDNAVINTAGLCTVKRHLKESIPVEITVSR